MGTSSAPHPALTAPSKAGSISALKPIARSSSSSPSACALVSSAFHSAVFSGLLVFHNTPTRLRPGTASVGFRGSLHDAGHVSSRLRKCLHKARCHGVAFDKHNDGNHPCSLSGGPSCAHSDRHNQINPQGDQLCGEFGQPIVGANGAPSFYFDVLAYSVAKSLQNVDLPVGRAEKRRRFERVAQNANPVTRPCVVRDGRCRKCVRGKQHKRERDRPYTQHVPNISCSDRQANV